jgi:2-oxoacid:acceptor oxidoreductase gamma subunit (pyruvate/2-ketoisovalerate family)/2-oxoacid:acceptor oxidoreductase delta subunit (pyruvate/2-ketoisovalerate family)
MQKPSNMIEIRGHARGGQGMVTAFEMLARIFSYCYNYEVQAFPFFGVERTGAPIQAYLRISSAPILVRSYIYRPNVVIVFDEGLLENSALLDGLPPDGMLIINSEKSPRAFEGKARRIITVPATRISAELKLGSKTLPIVNAAMIGAILRALEADVYKAADIIKQEVPVQPEANVEAAISAYNNINELTDTLFRIQQTNGTAAKGLKPESPVPFWDRPMSVNKTGSWRVVAPKFETHEAPCSYNCPAGTDVRRFVDLAAKGKFEEAHEVIYEHNPFPSICGRVCPHFCQQSCNRIYLDGNVNIGAIERYIGDYNNDYRPSPAPVSKNKKIAVVGAGPAGLTAALRLRNLGYPVTVYEAMPKAGGMMISGIPRFRLPEDVLDDEIRRIEEHGVTIMTGTKVTIAELEDHYSAVITAVGSHMGTGLNLGIHDGVIDGIEFLRNVNIHHKTSQSNKGEILAIIGGGNTAIDVARTALRFGAIPTIYYRRTKQEMPAIAHEVEEAVKEGVILEFLSAPVSLEPGNNGMLKLSIQKMELGEPDESGRRRPIPVPGSEKYIMVHKIITAIGQYSDHSVFSGVPVKARQGFLQLDEPVYKTPVFCAGDMAWGGTVVEAIASGNEVAQEIHAFLSGKPWVKDESKLPVASYEEINTAWFMPAPRNATPENIPKKLTGNFDEVTGSLNREAVMDEAGRCLHCGECFNCGNCFNFCPDAAIYIDEENRLRVNYDYCKGCGVCVRECPSSAIHYSDLI